MRGLECIFDRGRTFSAAAKSKLSIGLCTFGRKCKNWYIGVLRYADHFYPRKRVIRAMLPAQNSRWPPRWPPIMITDVTSELRVLDGCFYTLNYGFRGQGVQIT